MITYKTGDILTEDVEAVVNTVNCVGIMGRGIALQFKNVFPENFRAYAAACKQELVQPGRMFIYDTGELTNPKYVINFPTKRHWRGKSRMEDIESGLVTLASDIRERRIKSIAIPPLGCGLGGLNWRDVRSRIESALGEIDGLQVVVFEPDQGKTDARPNHSKAVPDMTPGRAALIGLMQRYLNGLLDPFISLLEVHKLMYFMQAAGESLRLKYAKGPFGPYAENLTHVLKAVEGHMISGYSDGGDAPNKQLQLVPGAAEDAALFLKGKADTVNRFDRVSRLLEGFETPFGLELLATVHWVMDQEEAQNADEVVARTYAWNERKKQFSSRQLNIAINALAREGWVSNFSSVTIR